MSADTLCVVLLLIITAIGFVEAAVVLWLLQRMRRHDKAIRRLVTFCLHPSNYRDIEAILEDKQ